MEWHINITGPTIVILPANPLFARGQGASLDCLGQDLWCHSVLPTYRPILIGCLYSVLYLPYLPTYFITYFILYAYLYQPTYILYAYLYQPTYISMLLHFILYIIIHSSFCVLLSKSITLIVIMSSVIFLLLF